MKKKYRIPDFNEFKLGFEYEIYSDGNFKDCVEDFCGWYKYEFQKGQCWRDISDIEYGLEHNIIRSKI